MKFKAIPACTENSKEKGENKELINFFLLHSHPLKSAWTLMNSFLVNRVKLQLQQLLRSEVISNVHRWKAWEWHTASETLVWIKVLADLTKQWSWNCSSVREDMSACQCVALRRGLQMQGVVSFSTVECHHDCHSGVWVVGTRGWLMLSITQPGASTCRSCGCCPLTASACSHSGYRSNKHTGTWFSSHPAGKMVYD